MSPRAVCQDLRSAERLVDPPCDLQTRQLDRIPVAVGPWEQLPARKTAISRVYTCAPTLVTQCGGPHKMAKALYGHVGGPDPRMVSEMRRLQQRVRDLEAELVRLQEENDSLVEAGHEDVLVAEREPAYV